MSKTVLFQTIQFSISTHFSSIWTIDRTLSGATNSGQSEPGYNGNEGALHISQSSSITGLFKVISWTLVGWGSLTSLQRCSQCIIQPQPTGQWIIWINGIFFLKPGREWNNPILRGKKLSNVLVIWIPKTNTNRNLNMQISLQLKDSSSRPQQLIRHTYHIWQHIRHTFFNENIF